MTLDINPLTASMGAICWIGIFLTLKSSLDPDYLPYAVKLVDSPLPRLHAYPIRNQHFRTFCFVFLSILYTIATAPAEVVFKQLYVGIVLYCIAGQQRFVTSELSRNSFCQRSFILHCAWGRATPYRPEVADQLFGMMHPGARGGVMVRVARSA